MMMVMMMGCLMMMTDECQRQMMGCLMMGDGWMLRMVAMMNVVLMMVMTSKDDGDGDDGGGDDGDECYGGDDECVSV